MVSITPTDRVMTPMPTSTVRSARPVTATV
jgi:hypothetical protein